MTALVGRHAGAQRTAGQRCKDVGGTRLTTHLLAGLLLGPDCERKPARGTFSNQCNSDVTRSRACMAMQCRPDRRCVSPRGSWLDWQRRQLLYYTAHRARGALIDRRTGCVPANGADRRRPLLLLAIMVVDMFSMHRGCVHHSIRWSQGGDLSGSIQWLRSAELTLRL